MYVLELYDRNIREFEIIAFSSSKGDLIEYAKSIEDLTKRGMVIKYCINGIEKSFNSCRVKKADCKGQLTYTGNIIFV